MADDRREQPSGGRREYDPPAVGLREHLEMLIRGMQVAVEAHITNLDVKFTEHSAQQTREHLEVVRRLRDVEIKVDNLEAAEQTRAGESKARAGTRFWLQWAPTVVATGAAVYAVLH